VKIVEIRGYELACPLPEPQGNAIGFTNELSTTLVSIRSEDGFVGWGESWASPAASATLIKRSLGPMLLGRDARDRNLLWSEMAERRLYDRGGITHMAISALDVALWDLVARSMEMPVWQLLGGRLRDRVPAYASGPYFRPGGDPYRQFIEETEGYLKAGFQAVKLRLGDLPQSDGRICREIRALIGADRQLMVDLNAGFDVRSALTIAHAIEEAKILWIEEPLRPDDLEGYRRLAQCPIAIAGGEALGGSEAFAPFLEARCLDVLQPDLAVCGGFTEASRIAGMAYATGTAVAPHVIGSFVNFFAALQFAATLPTRPAKPFQRFPVFEFDQTPNDLRAIVPIPPLNSDGTITIPDGPGLGFEIDPARLEPFIVDTWHLGA
jgi:D-galactarolactone cycloisomerase